MCLFEKEDQTHSLKKETHIVNPSILLGENPIILLWMSCLNTAAEGSSGQKN
jgi:hypothetical protein